MKARVVSSSTPRAITAKMNQPFSPCARRAVSVVSLRGDSNEWVERQTIRITTTAMTTTAA